MYEGGSKSSYGDIISVDQCQEVLEHCGPLTSSISDVIYVNVTKEGLFFTMLKNKPHLVTLHVNMLVSL